MISLILWTDHAITKKKLANIFGVCDEMLISLRFHSKWSNIKARSKLC